MFLWGRGSEAEATLGCFPVTPTDTFGPLRIKCQWTCPGHGFTHASLVRLPGPCIGSENCSRFLTLTLRYLDPFPTAPAKQTVQGLPLSLLWALGVTAVQ